MIEYYALSLAVAYCFGALIYWCTHRPKPVVKPYTEMEAILACTLQRPGYKKGYVHAFEAVRNNPNRANPKPNEER